VFALFKSNQSATYSLLPIEGTCYLYDYDQHLEPAALTNIRINACRKHTNSARHKDWYMFCFQNQSPHSQDCTLRAAEEGGSKNGPDYDPMSDNQTGFCRLGSIGGKIISNITYRQCRRDYPQWISFISNQQVAYRRGIVKIAYKKGGTTKLYDLTANCVLRDNDLVDRPGQHWGFPCDNSQQWCAYDNPEFCLKNSQSSP